VGFRAAVCLLNPSINPSLLLWNMYSYSKAAKWSQRGQHGRCYCLAHPRLTGSIATHS